VVLLFISSISALVRERCVSVPTSDEVVHGLGSALRVAVLAVEPIDEEVRRRIAASLEQQVRRPDLVIRIAEQSEAERLAALNAHLGSLDADVVAINDGASWHPRMLEIALDHLRRHPRQVAVLSPAAVTRQQRVLGQRLDVDYRSSDVGGAEVLDDRLLLEADRSPLASLVVRRAAAVACGGFDTQLTAAAGWDFSLRLLAHGEIGVLESEVDLVTLYRDDDWDRRVDDSLREMIAKSLRAETHERVYDALVVTQASLRAGQQLDGRISALSQLVDSVFDRPGLEARIRGYLSRLPRRLARRLRLRAATR
jgi:hypothetical protein